MSRGGGVQGGRIGTATTSAQAMPMRTAADRRRAAPCPKCGAEPQEKCRRRVSERYTTQTSVDGEAFLVTFQGRGRWLYLRTMHPERRPL